MKMFTLLYLILLVLLVLFSWIGSMYALVLPDGGIIPNLLSADSVRHLVRHCMDHMASAPIVTVLLLLIVVGAVKRCGLWSAMCSLVRERRLPLLTQRERYALRLSLGLLVVCVAVVAFGLVGPQANLLSVTGRIAGGPFSRGWFPLLSVCICVPCLCYGWLCGLWHSERDMLSALTSEVARHSSYFVTLLVASQWVAAMQYVHLFEWIGCSDATTAIVVYGIYLVPLVYSLITDR